MTPSVWQLLAKPFAFVGQAAYWGSWVLNIFFALAVLEDTRRLSASGRSTVLVGPVLCALGALLGGPMVAAAY